MIVSAEAGNAEPVPTIRVTTQTTRFPAAPMAVGALMALMALSPGGVRREEAKRHE